MRLSQNAAINFAGTVVPLAVTLVTIPLYLRLIGDVRFGVLAIVWLLLSYFGLFDLGLGRATSRFMASLHKCTAAKRESLFWTVLAVNVAFGFAGGAILWATGRFFLARFFHVPPDLQVEVLAALPWIAAAVPVATGVSVLGGALEGREQFLSLNSLQVFGAAVFQVVPLAVAWLHGPDLRTLIEAAVLARIGASLPMIVACRKHVPLRAEGRIELHWLRDLFSFCGWVTVSGVLTPILTGLDRMLVGAVQSAQALTYYTVAYNFSSKLTIVGSSVTRTLFPRFAMLEAAEAEGLARQAVLALTVLLTPMVIVAIVLLHPFFVLWLGPRLADLCSPAGQIFLLGFWINSLAMVPHVLLQARNRPDIVAKLHAIELFPFIAVLWLGLHYGGIEGAAWIWTLRAALDAIALFWFTGVSSKLLVLIAPASGAVLLTHFTVQQAGNGVVPKLAVCILVLGAFAFWTWIVAKPIATGVLDRIFALFASARTNVGEARV